MQQCASARYATSKPSSLGDRLNGNNEQQGLVDLGKYGTDRRDL